MCITHAVFCGRRICRSWCIACGVEFKYGIAFDLNYGAFAGGSRRKTSHAADLLQVNVLACSGVVNIHFVASTFGVCLSISGGVLRPTRVIGMVVAVSAAAMPNGGCERYSAQSG